MTDSVLIPTGDQMKSYACMRSLNRRDVRTIVASELDRIPHFSSRYCSENVHLSSRPADVLGYKEELLAIARRPDVVTAIPVRECDVYVFAKYRDEFDPHISLVTPQLATLRKAHDRLQLAREATSAGVPTARTRLLSDIDEWDTDVVIKSRFNVLTDEYLAEQPSDTLAEMKQVRFVTADDRPDCETVRREMAHDPIVQDFIPQADKHLYTAIWDRGEPLAAYQHRQLRQNSWVGGGGVYRTSAHSDAVDENATELLSHLGWHGLACIEYVKDAETGEWKFLEINPRVWQSMPEAVGAGADFPYYYWLQARDEGESIDLTYETGTYSHNAYGELSNLMSVRRDESPFVERPSFTKTALEIGSSCLRHPRFDYIRADDPGFLLNAVRRAVSSGITASRAYDGSGTSPHATAIDDGR